ncbi:hypothetical protein GOP47_0001413 [Adiantum capillus-veneris]|uniref:Small ribosomal subunit protein eS4 central region domain-containing protein n=1 Tax=Adiantum capillus-veneris TaxID=13818 RepID=A0A9D4ZQP6_ADICA|nr:hypothetical protein GOP47_0001413 [Adiantum capillus-veneris]
MLAIVGSPRPMQQAHKTRECLQMVVLLRNRLKYALTYREVVAIVMQRLISMDGKGIPYITTFDRCTIGYLDPLIKANDTIKIEIETGKVVEFIKFDIGNIVMVTVVATEVGLGLSSNVKSIREVLRFCTYKILPIKSFPPSLAMCLLLVKEYSLQ